MVGFSSVGVALAAEAIVFMVGRELERRGVQRHGALEVARCESGVGVALGLPRTLGALRGVARCAGPGRRCITTTS